MPDDSQDLLTIKQVAELLGVTVGHVRWLCIADRIPCTREGRRWNSRYSRLGGGRCAGRRGRGRDRGWNIATAYQCSDLKVSPADARAGESLTVFATVGETFLDGSRVTLYVDGRPAESQCVWARGDRKTGVEFALRLPAGKHELRVGDSKVSVVVR